MLQRVSFPVAGAEVEGVLHLPSAGAAGGVAVLADGEAGSEAPHVVATCEALAGGGFGAVRFSYRTSRRGAAPGAIALADAGGAVRLLKSHPALSGGVGVVGFGFGGAIAALVAGRDSRLRCAVLAGAPARIDGEPDWKPIAELSRTRGRVLLLRGSRDTRVAAIDVERYAAVLSAARVTRRVVTIDGADHHFDPAGPRAQALETIVAWVRDSL